MARFLPKIMLAARTAADFARNWRLVWEGSLADNRTITGADGQYSVKLADGPLEATEDGLIFNAQDMHVAEAVESHCLTIVPTIISDSGLSDETPTSVDPDIGASAGSDEEASRSDHRHNHANLSDSLDTDIQDDVVTDGSFSSSTMELTLTRKELTFERDSAGHMDAASAAASSVVVDLGAAAAGGGTNGTGSGNNTWKIHYKGEDSPTVQLSGGNWRDAVVRFWMRCCTAAYTDWATYNPPGPTAHTAGLQCGYTSPAIGGKVVGSVSTSDVGFTVIVADSGGALKVYIENFGGGTREVYCFIRVDKLGTADVSGATQYGDGH